MAARTVKSAGPMVPVIPVVVSAGSMVAIVTWSVITAVVSGSVIAVVPVVVSAGSVVPIVTRTVITAVIPGSVVALIAVWAQELFVAVVGGTAGYSVAVTGTT